MSDGKMRLANSIIGAYQKASELVEYAAKRTKMKLDFHRNRRAHRRIFGGTVGRILVVRIGSLGDVVRATAIVHELHVRYPAAKIDFVTSAAALPILASHPDLHRSYAVTELAELGQYDWVINLQNPAPLAAFLGGLTYRQVLEHLSGRIGARMISGRQLQQGREVSPTDINFCVTEFEELFLTALLDYDARTYPRMAIHVDEEDRARVLERLQLSDDRPMMGLFLGTNSVGCGADEGYRTLSMRHLENIISHFSARFTVAVFGQSRMRNEGELEEYRRILTRHPSAIDLVDRTSVEDLAALIDRFSVVVSCDSSPVHIAAARGVPVVGLYVSDATFKMAPGLEADGMVALNSATPCFKYSSRWKYFCESCRDPSTRARYCTNQTFVFGVDRISIDRIDRAVTRLLLKKEASRAGRGARVVRGVARSQAKIPGVD